MASSIHHFIVNFIFYDIFNVKRQNSFVTSLKRNIKKNKTGKNALFSPRSSIGAILVKQISVYTRHKKLHYPTFAHKESTTVLRLRLSDSFENFYIVLFKRHNAFIVWFLQLLVLAASNFTIKFELNRPKTKEQTYQSLISMHSRH